MKDYREIRSPYEPPEVTDDDVNAGDEELCKSKTRSSRKAINPLSLDNRVTLDLHSYILNDHEEAEAEAEDDELRTKPLRQPTSMIMTKR